MRLRLGASALLLTAVVAALLLRVQPEPPRTGLSALRVPAGFTVERIAGPELLSYGMMATLDDRGRLYVCESSGRNVRNEEMKARPEYKIRRLVDLDGDGTYDRSTVFADRLTQPAGAAWVRSGLNRGSLYVASPPDLIRFTDDDDNGVAEKKEIVVTGWNLSANAASLHGPILGPDGFLYLTDGRHGFKIRSKEGVLHEGRASRIWRVRPDGSGLEWVAGGGFDNPVEVVFTNAGEIIGTMTYFTDPRDGLRDALLHFVEGGVYPKPHRAADEFKRTGDWMPVMTKFARIAPSGLALTRGASWGIDRAGNLYSAQFNPHRVERHILHREGATFRTEDEEFLTSTDPDFHPTDVLEDADGSLIVIDTGAWFLHGCPLSRISKPAIRGGIYRVKKNDAAPVADARGEKLDWTVAPTELVSRLSDPRPVVRDRAADRLVEAGDASVAPLAGVKGTASVFVLGRIATPTALEALRAALADSEPDVRIVAARCLGMTRDRAAVTRLSDIVRKDVLPVRRQAAAALGQIGDSTAVRALLDAAADTRDRFLEHNIIYSLMQLGATPATLSGLADPRPLVRKAAMIALDQMDGKSLDKRDALALLADRDPAVSAAALWVATRHPDWSRDVVSQLRGFAPGDAVRDALLSYSSDTEAQKLVREFLDSPDTARRDLALDVIDRSTVKATPALWVDGLAAHLDSGGEALRLRVLAIFRGRGLAGYDEKLDRLARSGSDAVRLAALSALVARRPKLDQSSEDFLLGLLNPRREATLRMTAAQVIARCDLSQSALRHLARTVIPAADPLAAPNLIDALARNRNFAAEAQGLRVRLAAARSINGAKIRDLEPLLASGGDPGHGRQVFFGDKGGCASCHRMNGEGADVGPDLTAIGAIRSGHDLLEAIVFPSATFVPGHEVYQVVTATEVHSGVIKEHEPGYVLLTSGPNETVRIPRDRIKTIRIAEVSIMPDGFDQNLTRRELADLLAFLASQKTAMTTSQAMR